MPGGPSAPETASASEVDGGGLVRPQVLDPEGLEHLGGQRALERAGAGRAGREAFEVDEPAVGGESRQELVEVHRQQTTTM